MQRDVTKWRHADLGWEHVVLARAEVALYDQTSLPPTRLLLLQSHAQTFWEACSSSIKQINTGGGHLSQNGQKGWAFNQYRHSSLSIALHYALHLLPYKYLSLAKTTVDITPFFNRHRLLNLPLSVFEKPLSNHNCHVKKRAGNCVALKCLTHIKTMNQSSLSRCTCAKPQTSTPTQPGEVRHWLATSFHMVIE